MNKSKEIFELLLDKVPFLPSAFNKSLHGEFNLINIDNLVTPSSSIVSGQHLSCYQLLPATTQNIKPNIWLGDGAMGLYQQRTSQIPAANMYEFHNVYLVAHGCIVDKESRMFRSPHIISFSDTGLKAGFNLDLLDTSNQKGGKVRLKKTLICRKITQPCVPLAQPGEQAYGHWLVDNLPRVIFAQQLGIKVKYLSTHKLPQFGRKLLNLLGIVDEDIVTYDPNKEAIFMKECFFPSQLRWHSAISPLLATVREKFAPYQASCIHRKLFISRGDYNKAQSLTNAAEIYQLMSEYGIEIVEPHKYSQEEQIKLFSEADLVIGEYGSAMHNTLFSHPETNVIVLQPKAPLTFIQAGIGAVLNQPTGFIFGKSAENAKARIFHVPANFVKQAIEQVI